jgi:hypothetical protein
MPTITFSASQTLTLNVEEAAQTTLHVNAGDTVTVGACLDSNRCEEKPDHFLTVQFGSEAEIYVPAFACDNFQIEPLWFGRDVPLVAYVNEYDGSQKGTVTVVITPRPPKTPDEIEEYEEMMATDAALALAFDAAADAPVPNIGWRPALKWGGRAMAAMGLWRQHQASDPPDPNYTVIVDPVYPVLPPVAGEGVPHEVAEAATALQTNIGMQVALTRALITTTNRAQGAGDAADAYWEGQQFHAAATYASQLATLAANAASLRATYRSALETAGFPSVILDSIAVDAKKADIRSHGFGVEDLQVLTELGATDVSPFTSRHVLQGILSSLDTSTVLALGSFPECLTAPEIAAAEASVAAALAQFATRNGVQALGNGVPFGPVFQDLAATSVTVTWVAPSSASLTYTIERGPTTEGPWSLVASNVATTTISDSGLSPVTTYYYHLRSVGASGPSDWTRARKATTRPLPPSNAPGAPTFTEVYADVVCIAWDPALDAWKYKVESAADMSGQPGAWTQFAGPTEYYACDYGMAALDTGAPAALAPNTQYWYRVRGTNGGSDGPYSEARSIITRPSPPGPVMFGVVSPNTVTVNWTAAPGGAASYQVERGTSLNGPFTRISSGIGSLSYVDATVAPNITYWYRVRATNAMGLDSDPSAASVTTPDPSVTAPSAPGAPTFTNVRESYLYVNWTAAEGAVSYKVERAPDASGLPGTWTQIATGITELTFWDYSGVLGNTTFWYRVRGTNGGGGMGSTPMRAP